MRNLYYVAIEGTIGVGKTSLAKLLADRLSAKLVLETFEDNPFLADFYDDPEAHAFQTQLWFLLQRSTATGFATGGYVSQFNYYGLYVRKRSSFCLTKFTRR